MDRSPCSSSFGTVGIICMERYRRSMEYGALPTGQGLTKPESRKDWSKPTIPRAGLYERIPLSLFLLTWWQLVRMVRCKLARTATRLILIVSREIIRLIVFRPRFPPSFLFLKPSKRLIIDSVLQDDARGMPGATCCTYQSNSDSRTVRQSTSRLDMEGRRH